MRNEVNYATLINPIRVNAAKVDFVECAEHVGIERSTSGNSVSIFTRFNAHKRALGAVLHAGLARGHRGNPQAGLRVEQLYGVPVLLSGLAPLVLTKTEENLNRATSQTNYSEYTAPFAAYSQVSRLFSRWKSARHSAVTSAAIVNLWNDLQTGGRHYT